MVLWSVFRRFVRPLCEVHKVGELDLKTERAEEAALISVGTVC